MAQLWLNFKTERLPALGKIHYTFLLLFIFTFFSAKGQSCECPPISTCQPCEGGLVSLRLKYNPSGLNLTFSASDGGGELATGLLTSEILVESRDGAPFQDDFVTISILGLTGNLIESETIITSCADPIFEGSVFGNFTVLEGESLNGGTLCCAPDQTENTPPVFSNCPADINVNADENSCGVAVSWTEPNATDDCGTVTVTSNYSPGDTFDDGITQVIYTATDAYGNTSTCSFNVNVSDVTAPSITGYPLALTVAAGSTSCNAAVIWSLPNVTDNCTASPSLSSNYDPGDLFPLGETVVVYTSTDEAGNSTSVNFKVNVLDVTSPRILNCPSNITIGADDNCEAVVNWGTPSVSDNCDDTPLLTSDFTSGSTFPLGETIVTYTARDDANNTSTCSFKVTVLDNTAPVISNCPADITIYANESCEAVATWSTPSVSDNCDDTPSLTADFTSGSTFPLGETIVTYTAKDDANNTSTCSFKVTVLDNTAPVISNCPADITIYADESCEAVATWSTPSVSDNCDDAPTLTSDFSSGSTFPLGETVVTYTAKDEANNTSTCSLKVTVLDNTAPVISDCPTDMTIYADESCEAVATWSTPSVSDNCDDTPSLTADFTSGSTFPLGKTIVTYTAKDDSNNTSTCSFKVTVLDNTAPVISNCPADITIYANESCEAVATWSTPSVSDNCDDAPTLTSNFTSGSTLPLGETVVTYTARDDANNTSTCSFKVTVLDNTAPVIADCATDITIYANESCEAVATWSMPSVSDNCDDTPSLIADFTSGSTFPLGETIVTYTAKDDANNTSTCSFKVTVLDNTAPVISNCPTDMTIYADESCEAVATWSMPSVSDNCDDTPSLTADFSSGSTFPLGETIVTYTAKDDANNTSTCSFKVTVLDNTAPVISDCPTDITIYANESCEAVATWSTPSVSDNCDDTPALTADFSSGSTFPLGETIVTYTAKDDANNTSTCSFKVTVLDNTAPVIGDCPVDITIYANESCKAVATWSTPSVSDNCDDTPSLTSDFTSGSTFPLGETIVTYTAKDDANNTSTCSFKVTVLDNTAPVISNCPADITIYANESCEAVATWSTPSVSDDCDDTPSLAADFTSGSTFPLGETIVTYTARDEANNTSTCSFKVTVLDNTAPVIGDCPVDITIYANESCEAVATWSTPSVSDNCDDTPSLTSDFISGSTFPLGETIVTYTAKDDANNTSTCSFKVTVLDNTAPVISNCPADITIYANESCEAVATWSTPSVSDDCDDTPSLAADFISGSTFPLGETIVTYTAKDEANNTSTCSFKVTVLDNTAPVISDCPTDITIYADESCEAVATWSTPSVSDNCDDTPSLTADFISGSTFPLGETIVTYTAKDEANNTSTCFFKVTVLDNTAPAIADCPADIIIYANESCEAVATWSTPSVSDNCDDTPSLNSDFTSGSTFPLGETVVTYTARDEANNTSSCSFKVTVLDNTAPVISNCPVDITIYANESCEAVATWSTPFVSENCDGAPTLTSDFTSGSTFPLGETVVTYTAKDNANNTSTCSFKVTVIDNTAPVISNCPEDLFLTSNSSCQAVATWDEPFASDNCSAEIGALYKPGDIFPIGKTLVQYTATDPAGNFTKCEFNIIVEPGSTPVFTSCPNDLTIYATENCEALATWMSPAIQSCSKYTLTSSHQPGDSFALGSTVVTYTAVSKEGYSSICSFTVTVVDNQAPQIHGCPAPINVVANSTCSATVSWEAPSATDNCDTPVLSSNYESGSEFPIGTTEVIYTVKDASGNKSTCSFAITVSENVAPTFLSCPENQVVEVTEPGGVPVTWIEPEAKFTCAEGQITSSHYPGDLFYPGTTTVEYTASTPGGMTSNCTFDVTVTIPEINLDIMKVITPDGDGINDTWILRNIEKFKNNTINVFDRWGGIIYSASGYNNESIVWKGESKNGSPVPTGTYFFTISVSNGVNTIKKEGFVELVR